DGPQPVPELSGLLKAQPLRRALHLLRQVPAHLLEAPLQQGDRLGDGLGVLLMELVSTAVAVALAHVEIETGPLLSQVPGEFLPTGGQAERPPQGVQNGLGAVTAGVGPEIPRPVL